MSSITVMISALQRGLAQLPYLPWVLALVWTAARGWTLAWAALLVIQAMLPVAFVYLTRAVVDSLAIAFNASSASQAGDSSLPLPILYSGAMLAAIALLSECLRGAMGWIQTAQSERVQDHIRSLIHQKSMGVDLAFYDSPDFYDRLHRARDESGDRPLRLIEHMGVVLQHTLTLCAMSTILAPFGLGLPIALLVSTLPACAVVIRSSIRHHHWWARTTPEERRAWYYDWLLTAEESAAELRLFGLGKRFQSTYQAIRQTLRLERLQLARAQSLAEAAAGMFAVGITGLAYGWIIWQALHGLWTLGEVALFYQAFHQGQRLVRSILDNAGLIYTNTLFLESLFDFLALQPQIVDPVQPTTAPHTLHHGIRFQEVTFRYPDNRKPVLHDFNLTIPPDQIIAIVGANGVGKSTLIKLLCRLYDPDSGRIEIDGIDIRQLRLEDLRSLLAVLFQHPVHYHTSAADNIALGNPTTSTTAPDLAAIQAAAQAAGADETIRHLPEGYDTPLGKWLTEGTELSGGQWQRLALARACLRQAPIVLLDEPTSAMDPWTEGDWMDRFRTHAAGRTAVIITHRMTTAMRADTIHVMRHGRIVESGCHASLSAKGGYYAQAWTAQFDHLAADSLIAS